jgi:hypothetical protein
MICYAWVSASMGPLKGNNQKAFKFYQSIAKKYRILQLEVEEEDNPCRFPLDWMQLKNRFTRHIQPNCFLFSLFNKFYKRIADSPPSGEGTTPERILELAMKEWKATEGRDFQCWAHFLLVLQKVPKWDTNLAADPQVVVLGGGWGVGRPLHSSHQRCWDCDGIKPSSSYWMQGRECRGEGEAPVWQGPA